MWSVSHPSVRTHHIYVSYPEAVRGAVNICGVFCNDEKDFAVNKINKKSLLS